jgi:hypothetical protein
LLALKELLSIGSSVSEKGVEMIAAPLNAVLNLIREISQCAHWDSFFRRILGVSVALGLVRNNHLLVSLGSECTRLEQWFLIPDTSAVDVETSFDIVDGVYNEVP